MTANFVPGRILTAAQLNGAFDAKANTTDLPIAPAIYGAEGDGVTFDTTPIAESISASLGDQGVINTQGKSYLVASYSNPLGKRFTGGGKLLANDPHGGLVQLNSYGDDGKVFFGKEYLYRLFLRLKSGGNLTMFLYGDSTVATAAQGGGYAGPNFEPQVLLPDYLIRVKGVRNNIACINRGVAGTRVVQMNAIPDIDVIGGTTDVFIIKYGINDAQDGVQGFATNLRAQLAAIRANSHGTVDQLAIVLVGPSATYDPQHGRASPWYESIRGIYVQAARDFQCAYFDTYAYLRDINWAAGKMMSDDFGNGQGVHPTEIMQTMIWGGLTDCLLGDCDMHPYTSDAWQAITLGDGWANYGSGYSNAYASMSRDGWVSLRGMIMSGTIGANRQIAPLPLPVMIPSVAEHFPCSTAAGFCSIRINTNGYIEQADGNASATYTSLSGIRFKPRG
ncbi:SGNH/GDSL hydrolase family protein [Burkholderia arboris]|uniref:SGNH/GDSL hydrolase family protein n=1 Tax=Burkholderia arboris TaxID=488730 RepID=UPI001CF0ECA9|nr:SGNH/GDSL hydrolase family protein [Burkholderia arboris]MCA8045467.1 SGNH/GDSL hydrolase family protein [Burkholderia arboris]